MNVIWLEWAKRIQAIAQSGLAFTKDVFDKERYEELRKISAEIMVNYTNVSMEKIPELFTNETGYQTPKVDIRGVVFQDNKLLLVREKNDNKWSLPGGFCDIGLSPAENVVKEIKEESGYEVRAVKLLGILDLNKHTHAPQPYHYYKILFLCDIIGGQPLAGIETKEIDFFGENEIPPLSISRTTLSQVELVFEYLKDASKASYFD